MTDKVTLNNLTNLQNENTAVTAVNGNNATLTTALNNTLSRDGTSPNTMGSQLDMNSNRIINLATPVNPSDAVNLSQLQASISGLATSSGTTTSISAAMLPVVQSTTIAQADAALGITPAMQTVNASSTVAAARTALGISDYVPNFNVKNYGAIGDGTVNDYTAVQACLTAALAAGGRMYFPYGTYKMLTGLTGTIPAGKSFTMHGDGQDASILHFPSGVNGIVLEVGYTQTSSFHLRDFTIMTSEVGGHTAIKLQNTTTLNTLPGVGPENDITNVTIRGSVIDVALNTYYWAEGIKCQNIDLVNYYGVNYCGGTRGSNLGIGIIIQGEHSLLGGSPAYANVHVLTSCNFTSFNIGVQYGTEVQGVFLQGCNFDFGARGVYCPTVGYNQDQLSVVGCQFGGMSTAGIDLSQRLNCVTIIGNLFIIAASSSGINLVSDNFTVVGNCFVGQTSGGNSDIGCNVNTTTAGGVITGNCFNALTYPSALQASTTLVHVATNNYYNCGNATLNLGTLNTVGTAVP